jgi:hypothetical protein
MSCHAGPDTVESGLVLSLDAGNIKSYPGSGTTWIDLSENKTTGTLTGGPTFSIANGKTIVFDASNDYVEFGNPSSLNFATGDFTVEVWATRYSNATTNLRVFSKGAGADALSEAGFCLFGSDTTLVFTINHSAGTPRVEPAGIPITVGVPFCITCVLERSTTVRTFKNGVFNSSIAAPAGSVTGAATFVVGCNGTAAGTRNVFWSGEISNIKIYNRALTNTEVSQNFNALRGRFGL